MKIPNYDSASSNIRNYTQLLPYMPSNTFRMLICGKTNTLMHLPYKLLFFDKIHLYAKNLEQPKYREFLETFARISDDDKKKLVIFDDFVCENNQKTLVDYFIHGRHKNCSLIYLSQSYYDTPKDSIAHILAFLIVIVLSYINYVT